MSALPKAPQQQISSQDLYEYAIELRQLAYTMPGGHEDPLIWLSEKMVRHAHEGATR